MQDLDRRKPGTSRFTTQRREDDEVKIFLVYLKVKLPASIGLLIENTDQRSKDYSDIKDVFRPGHADYTYHQKYGIVITVVVDALLLAKPRCGLPQVRLQKYLKKNTALKFLVIWTSLAQSKLNVSINRSLRLTRFSLLIRINWMSWMRSCVI